MSVAPCLIKSPDANWSLDVLVHALDGLVQAPDGLVQALDGLILGLDGLLQGQYQAQIHVPQETNIARCRDH